MASKKNYPSKPESLKCESEQECINDAEQLCIIKVGGAVSCAELAKDEGYPSAQVSALCSLATAELLQQKYSLDEAIFDTFIGLMDDVADSGLESDSLIWNFFGVVAKTTTIATKYQQYRSCKRNYTRRFYSPYENWQTQIRNIDNEPHEKYQKCEDDKSNLKTIADTIYKKKKLLEEFIVISNSVRNSLEKIKSKEIKILPSCM